MSDHTWTLENLAAYLADGLEPAERERLEAHTAECATCASALNAARDTDVMLTELFAPARPSVILEDRVIQALRTRPPDIWRLPVPG
jgi:anti-sigma factor RsiW